MQKHRARSIAMLAALIVATTVLAIASMTRAAPAGAAAAARAADPAHPTTQPDDAEGNQRKVYDQLERYLDRQIAQAERDREAAWHRDVSSIAAYEKSIEPWRQKLWDLLGGIGAYPPAPRAALDPKEELIAERPTHRAYRVWLTAFDDVRVYGILLVPTAKPAAGGKTAPPRFPALICVHGMQGTPESVCGFTEKPDYLNHFGLQAVERGYVVFAPANINTVKGRSTLDRKAILAGQRLQALEQYKMLRVMDYLQSRDDVDVQHIGAYGISWGGRTVMNGAALDPRIAACAISGHFNDLVRKMIEPSEHYTPYIATAEDYAFFPNHARLFSDIDVVSLICPRPVFIEQGRGDRVVYWEISKRAFEQVKQIYDKLGIGDRAEYGLFDGPHEIHGTEAFAFFDRWLKPEAAHSERAQ